MLVLIIALQSLGALQYPGAPLIQVMIFSYEKTQGALFALLKFYFTI